MIKKITKCKIQTGNKKLEFDPDLSRYIVEAILVEVHSTKDKLSDTENIFTVIFKFCMPELGCQKVFWNFDKTDLEKPKFSYLYSLLKKSESVRFNEYSTNLKGTSPTFGAPILNKECWLFVEFINFQRTSYDLGLLGVFALPETKTIKKADGEFIVVEQNE